MTCNLLPRKKDRRRNCQQFQLVNKMLMEGIGIYVQNCNDISSGVRRRWDRKAFDNVSYFNLKRSFPPKRETFHSSAYQRWFMKVRSNVDVNCCNCLISGAAPGGKENKPKKLAHWKSSETLKKIPWASFFPLRLNCSFAALALISTVRYKIRVKKNENELLL